MLFAVAEQARTGSDFLRVGLEPLGWPMDARDEGMCYWLELGEGIAGTGRA